MSAAYIQVHFRLDFIMEANTMTSRTVLAYKTGLSFFCLQEPIFDVLVIFFVLKLEVYVCLVKSLLILSFYISKQLNESQELKIRG